MPFATTTDVEARLGRSLSSSEQTMVADVLAEVTSAIQIYTGQRFENGVATFTVRTDNGSVSLPQRPVKSITSVNAYGSDYLNYEVIGNTIAGLPRGTSIEIVYEYGYDDIPDAIQGICVRAAMRALASPEGQALASVTVGGYTETYVQPKNDSGVVLGLADKAILDRYKQPAVRTVFTR